MQSVRLAVGHHGYFEALITALELAPAARHALLDAVDRNSDAALAAFLRRVPLNRSAKVDDVADAVQFLASGMAACITGVLLPVDGGYCAA